MKKETRGRPRQSNEWTVALLQSRSDAYFRKCDSRVKRIVTVAGEVEKPFPIPYTLEGLCCYLKISVVTFRNWRKKSGEFGEYAQFLHQKITANHVEGALDGSQNSSFARFLLVNNNSEDYRDRVEVENTVSDDVKSLLEMAVGSWKTQLKN